ncbi:hypothetical protein A3715_15660 [Oleiphilus sp. HI0009]|nr:hypothetical protein A3715_15660 [Oleiphilus sp. HI0009]
MNKLSKATCLFLCGLLCSKSFATEFNGIGDVIGVTKGKKFIGVEDEENLSSQQKREKEIEAIAPKTEAAVLSKVKKGVESRLGIERNIRLESGENRILKVSKGQLNRVITPFKNPVIMNSAKENEATIFSTGNVIYFGSSSDRPIGVYVTPENDPSVSLSITFDSKAYIKPQEYHIELDGYSPKQREKKKLDDEQQEKINNFERIAVSEYNSWIKAFGYDLAMGNIPPGYSVGPVQNNMRCKLDGLSVEPFQKIEGTKFYVDVYKVINKTSKTKVIVDQQCHKNNVKFIMPWPSHMLEAGDKAELFVVNHYVEQEFNKRVRFVE